ncbi:hypothetical protein Q1695_000293 [Nippostrongylus brasiliensis]|nr:hypothetical protein Q1695_000293 [Nippostrongylus brasiliensis]
MDDDDEEEALVVARTPTRATCVRLVSAPIDTQQLSSPAVSNFIGHLKFSENVLFDPDELRFNDAFTDIRYPSCGVRRQC